MTREELDVLLVEIRAVVREELARAPGPAAPFTLPPALEGVEGWLATAALHLDREGRGYVTQGDILAGLNIPHALWMPLRWPLRAHLRRLGWREGKRGYLGGRSGPRVTPYYAPQGQGLMAEGRGCGEG